jgi:hypothetical protein
VVVEAEVVMVLQLIGQEVLVVEEQDQEVVV